MNKIFAALMVSMLVAGAAHAADAKKAVKEEAPAAASAETAAPAAGTEAPAADAKKEEAKH